MLLAVLVGAAVLLLLLFVVVVVLVHSPFWDGRDGSWVFFTLKNTGDGGLFSKGLFLAFPFTDDPLVR